MAALEGVLLDIDVTLVDSNDAHAEAWVEALAGEGRQVSFERVRPLIGMGSEKLLRELASLDAESGAGRRITERRKEIFREKQVPRLRPLPGARELLERFKDDGLRLVVASSASDEDLQVLLRVARVEDLIDRETSADDADRSKPDPDIVEAALKKGRLAPAAALLLGDTPYDVEAGRRAGVGVVGVRCGGWDEAGLRGALAVYEDPADVLGHYESSPFARARQQESKV